MIVDAKVLLARATDGDERAAEDLSSIIYEKLHELAEFFLRDMGNGTATLQPTALVHEAYLKLINADPDDFRSRTHFVAVASCAMRQVLLDHLKANRRQKRGGDWKRITLGDAASVNREHPVDIEQLDRALTELGQLDERAARVVELKFFGGLKEASVAEMLGVSSRTIRGDWAMAKAWLRSRLETEEGGAGG